MFAWYRVSSNGQEQLISGATTLTLNDITDEYKYKLVITSTLYPQFYSEGIYNAVYINDYEADWNYYQGLNYVQSDNGALPGGNNQNIYNENNMVKVQLCYSSGEVLNDRVNIGRISTTERENEYVYYKYYPVVSGKVRIELIENPFIDRPKSMGFNNWVPDGVGTISYDDVVYKRYLEANVTYTNGKPDDMSIPIHASWVEAKVAKKDSGNTWADVFAPLDAKGAVQLNATPNQYTNCSMAGYYTRSGSNYTLIQSYDGNRIYNSSTTYYYMATRDTNIVYLNGNVSNAWASAQSKPFTFTSVHDGIDYRANSTWTVSGTYVQIYNDTTIENIKIQSGAANASANPPGNITTNGNLYGGFKNLKMGRGVIQSGTSRNFLSIVAGSASATGSANSTTKYNVIIESGFYNNISLTNVYSTSSTVNVYINMTARYGSDYDRVKNDNSKLDIYFIASGAWGSNIQSSTTTAVAIDLVVKSGRFGSGRYDHTTGIYVGGRAGRYSLCN